MKYLASIVSLSVLVILSGSCEKEYATIASKQANASSIVGRWELRQSLSQVGKINFPAGNGSRIQFDVSSYLTPAVFIQSNYPKQGHYQVIADTSVNTNVGLTVSPGEFTNRIILNNDTNGIKIFYQITNNKLVILSGFFPTDGGVELTYERQ